MLPLTMKQPDSFLKSMQSCSDFPPCTVRVCVHVPYWELLPPFKPDTSWAKWRIGATYYHNLARVTLDETPFFSFAQQYRNAENVPLMWAFRKNCAICFLISHLYFDGTFHRLYLAVAGFRRHSGHLSMFISSLSINFNDFYIDDLVLVYILTGFADNN